MLLERRGEGTIEALIAFPIGVIAVCYLPWLGGPSSVVLAAGIVGATVMPHALYLHGNLTRGRDLGNRINAVDNLRAAVGLDASVARSMIINVTLRLPPLVP